MTSNEHDLERTEVTTVPTPNTLLLPYLLKYYLFYSKERHYTSRLYSRNTIYSQEVQISVINDTRWDWGDRWRGITRD